MMSPSTVVMIIAGVVRAKAGAVLLGPERVGIYGQLLSSVVMSTALTSLCMATGLTQRITEARVSADREGLARSVTTVLAVTLSLSILATAVCFLSADSLSSSLLGSGKYGRMILIACGAILPMSLSGGVLMPILFGTLAYARYSWGRAISTILTTAAYLAAAYAWGLEGAILSILLGAVADALVMGWCVVPLWRQFGMHIRLPSATIVADLLRFSAVSFGVSVATYGAGVSARAAFLSTPDPASAGFYHVASALGGYWTVFFSNAIWASTHPELAGADARRQRTILDSALSALLPPTIAAALVLVAFRDNLLGLLYSKAFVSAGPYVAFQSVGDVAMVGALVFGVYQLAQKRRKAFFVWQILPQLPIFAVGVPLVKLGYPLAVPVCYAMGQLSTLVGVWVYEGSSRATLMKAVGGFALVFAVARAVAPWSWILAGVGVLACASLIRRASAQDASPA